MQTITQKKSGYFPEEKESFLLHDTYDKGWKTRYAIDRGIRYFNSRNLTQYINDSTRRWNGFIPPRDDMTQDWQARTFNNFTRNTVISFLAKAAMQPPEILIEATNKQNLVDVQRSHVMEKLYQFSQAQDNGRLKFFNAALELTTKGTVVCYEGYGKTEKKIKEIISYDEASGAIKTKEKTITDFDGCFREIIPIEDFWFGNIWEPEMQKQPYVMWRKVIRMVNGEQEYGKYPHWKKYVMAGYYNQIAVQNPFFKDGKFSELTNDQVEIIKYYDAFTDDYRIVANGVLLYHGAIPFHHKKLPFTKAIFEPFAFDFVYGKSLPSKIETEQDIVNTLTNMMIDQTYLSTYKPILSDDPDDITDTVLIPGLLQKVNNKDSYRVLNELTGPDSSHFNMLQLMVNNAKENSGPVMGGGNQSSPRGQAVTARQALLAEEESRQILGLNSLQLESFEKDCAELRVKNILQFYTQPQKIKAVAGVEASEYSGLFKLARVDNTKLSSGGYGTSIIEMRSEESMPTPDELAVKEEMASLQGQETEIIAVTPDYIRQVEYDIQAVEGSIFRKKKTLEQALGLEFYNLMLANPLIDQAENTRAVIELYDKNPEDFIRQTPGLSPGMAGAPQPMGATSATNQVTGSQNMSIEGMTL